MSQTLEKGKRIGSVTEFNNALIQKKILIRSIVKGLHTGHIENCFVGANNMLVSELNRGKRKWKVK